MCSVSFLPDNDGFHLAMNRDEELSRATALPPAFHRCGGLGALYPHEPNGGTWIGINDAGMTFALINWYSQPRRQGTDTLSRGLVIPGLLAAGTARDAERLLTEMPFARLNPFRLIVISPVEKCLREWRSNGARLESEAFPWQKRHWFSSGFDERKASRVRGLTCRRAAGEADADTLPWLRRLHRSHLPARGAFSMCMHRADACTVSCTEISATRTEAVMTYHAGPPCVGGPPVCQALCLLASKSNCTA